MIIADVHCLHDWLLLSPSWERSKVRRAARLIGWQEGDLLEQREVSICNVGAGGSGMAMHAASGTAAEQRNDGFDSALRPELGGRVGLVGAKAGMQTEMRLGTNDFPCEISRAWHAIKYKVRTNGRGMAPPRQPTLAITPHRTGPCGEFWHFLTPAGPVDLSLPKCSREELLSCVLPENRAYCSELVHCVVTGSARRRFCRCMSSMSRLG